MADTTTQTDADLITLTEIIDILAKQDVKVSAANASYYARARGLPSQRRGKHLAFPRPVAEQLQRMIADNHNRKADLAAARSARAN